MSTTYTAYTVIGVRLTRKELTRETSVRGCGHTLVDREAVFCSRCGKNVWVRESEPLFEISDVDGQSLVVNPNIKLVDLYYESDDCFIGMVFSSDYKTRFGFTRVPADKVVQDLVADLKVVLGPYNLWDEKKFGIYTVAQIS